MSGTIAGGKHAAQTNKEEYGQDFYAVIGAKGGAKSRTGGFFGNSELARLCGALGGRIGTRSPNKMSDTEKAIHRAEFQRNYDRLMAINKRATQNA